MAARPQNSGAVGAGPSSYNGNNSDSARKTQMGLSWNAYYGRFPKPLKRTRGVDDNIIDNRCRPIVDVGVDFLFGQDLALECAPGSPKGAQDYLDATLGANKLMSFLMRLGINGGVTGHPMLKLVLEQPYPRLVVLDPTIVSVQTAPDDIDRVTAYILQYPMVDDNGEEAQRRQIIKRQEGGAQTQWLILDQQQGGSGGAEWTNLNPPVIWPYSWPPILDGQNLPAPNQYFGLSDIGPDLIEMNNDLNFILSNMARIIRFHAHPKTWGRGFNADQLKVAVDGLIVLPGENATLQNLEMHSDLASSLHFAEVIRSGMDEISRVPSIAIGNMKDVPKGQISGVALNLIYKPLLQKTEVKRRLYGDLLIELCRRLLEVGGFGPDCVITIHWPNMLPDDAQAMAQTALMWAQLGISHATIIAKLGFDPDLEAEKTAQEHNPAIPDPNNPHPTIPAPENLMPGDPTRGGPDDLAMRYNVPPMNGLMNVARPA